jgi:hypothetical protein
MPTSALYPTPPAQEETTDSPLGLAAEKIKTAVKTTATQIKEVLVDREDPIVNVGEEGEGIAASFLEPELPGVLTEGRVCLPPQCSVRQRGQVQAGHRDAG